MKIFSLNFHHFHSKTYWLSPQNPYNYKCREVERWKSQKALVILGFLPLGVTMVRDTKKIKKRTPAKKSTKSAWQIIKNLLRYKCKGGEMETSRVETMLLKPNPIHLINYSLEVEGLTPLQKKLKKCLTTWLKSCRIKIERKEVKKLWQKEKLSLLCWTPPKSLQTPTSRLIWKMNLPL